MMAFLKNVFSKKKSAGNQEDEVYRYELKEYDRTYEIPLSVLKLIGIRLLCKDSTFVRTCWNIFYWFEFVNLFVVTWLELGSMAQTARGGSLQDALQIFRMMPCIGYLLLAMTKTYKMVCYRSVYENLYSELRDMWPQGEVSKEAHNVIKTGLKHLGYALKGYYWCNNGLLVMFLTPPFVEVIKRWIGQDVPLILPFFYWFPFDPFQRVYYEIILVFQTWHGLITIWFMVSSDLLFCIFLSHITTQFDLLALRVRRFAYVPIDEQLPEEFPLGVISKEIASNKRSDLFNSWAEKHRRELSEVVLRHKALIRLAGDIESLFSFALLLNFFNSSIIICFCGFCCVMIEKWNEMIYKSFMTTALSQTWLLCWYGQRLLDSSLGVANALYNSGWYRVDKTVTSMILIMFPRSQKEVHVTTYGFSVISLESYATIIKTSWSYFTLLLNIYKK